MLSAGISSILSSFSFPSYPRRIGNGLRLIHGCLFEWVVMVCDCSRRTPGLLGGALFGLHASLLLLAGAPILTSVVLTGVWVLTIRSAPSSWWGRITVSSTALLLWFFSAPTAALRCCIPPVTLTLWIHRFGDIGTAGAGAYDEASPVQVYWVPWHWVVGSCSSAVLVVSLNGTGAIFWSLGNFLLPCRT